MFMLGPERLLAQRERARERHVMARAADPQRRRHERVAEPKRDRLGERVADQRVDRQREVRPVLLGRAAREHDTVRAHQRADLRRRQLLHADGRHQARG
jgi:hypothetical protein